MPSEIVCAFSDHIGSSNTAEKPIAKGVLLVRDENIVLSASSMNNSVTNLIDSRACAKPNKKVFSHFVY